MSIHVPRPPQLVEPRRQRSHGIVDLRLRAIGGATRLLDLSESGPSRLRFPNARGGTFEAILVNTAGGIACGDHFDCSLTLEAGTEAVFTTTAAEKIYRSDGPVSVATNRLVLQAGARLAWLPQETILFDRARLSRSFEADLTADAGLILCEIVAFGRQARGERLCEGLFEDRWRIRRDGRLTYADATRLAGPIADLLARPAIGGGAAALATILDVSPEAETRLDEARARLEAIGVDALGVEAGASAWNGHLAIRMLGRNLGAVRATAAVWLQAYRAAPMPRVWQV